MPNESTTRTAVVVGATGIIGRAIAAKLAELGGWRVLGVTRSGGAVPGVDENIAVYDLSDPEEARAGDWPLPPGATHQFFAAYLPFSRGWAAESRAEPRGCWSTRSRGWRAVGAPLAARHTHHRGQVLRRPSRPVPERPAAETEAPASRPEFLHTTRRTTCGRRDAAWRVDQSGPDPPDRLRHRQPGMNLALSVAVYASLVRAAGLRRDFPGSAAAFGAMTQIVDAEQLLAEAAAWAAAR